MKKAILPLIVGALLGALVTWVALKRTTTEAEAEPPKGLASAINPDTASIVKQMAEVGLTTGEPKPVQVVPEVKGYGRVLDPGTLLALAAEVRAADAAAAATAKEYQRTKSLYDQDQNASLQAVESAEAAMLRDRLQLASANARLIAGWGAALSKRNDLPTLLDSLAAGTSALVRIDLPAGDAGIDAPKSARIRAATGDQTWSEVEILGPSPSSDPQAGGFSYLALWREARLRPGAPLQASLTGSGAAQALLEVPKDAVVRYKGGAFVYVQSGDHNFERRLVTLGASRDSGIVVTDGLKKDDKIVVTGAQQILSTEIIGAGGGGEE